jgi:hypothetical protein
MNITFPEWYDDLSEFDCRSKGCALNFKITLNKKIYLFNFYDITRFSQDAQSEINQHGHFRDEDAVILPEVTKENITNYLKLLT